VVGARKPLLVIAGPTGVGKTAAAVALARRLPIEVVSADSRQVYRGMDAATGKPTGDERRAVRHHLVDVVDPGDRYDASRFRRDAAVAIDAIRGRGRLPVVVGGTGLYIRALLRGLDPAPAADPEFRRTLAAIAASEGRAALHGRLGREAPELARRLHPNDHVRVIRALELVRAGSPVGDDRVRWHDEPGEYRAVYVALTADRAVLWPRLRLRAREMAGAGLLDEVRGLLARGCDPALPAMRGIGYRQFVDVARGATSEADAIASMERATVEYARRQVTWFRREPGVRWLDVAHAGGPDGAVAAIEALVMQEGLIE
jgi:tRNA dimethylallyltransferase